MKGPRPGSSSPGIVTVSLCESVYLRVTSRRAFFNALRCLASGLLAKVRTKRSDSDTRALRFFQYTKIGVNITSTPTGQPT